MEVIFGLAKIKRIPQAVVAIGVFDGVHRAHRQILKYAVKQAHRIKGKSVAVTFWPHPQAQASLYSLKHRLRLIAETGIDACIVINFSRHFSHFSAEDFVKNILVNKLGARYICIGKNFRFGKGAYGDYRLLQHLARSYNFKLKVFPVMTVKGKAVSSTFIRRLIQTGNLKGAEALLLRPVSVLGTVIRGGALATRLGFPTANINPHHEVLPPSGVYAVKVFLKPKVLQGICYIGSKPTFGLRQEKHIEVHIFNFKKNIYGKDLEIQFVQKIREEKKFVSPAILARQIKKDASLAPKLLSRH